MNQISKFFLVFVFLFYSHACLPDDLSKAHEPLISLDFREAELSNVLRLLSEQYDVNIVTGQEVKGQVTVRLTNVTFESALKAILEANGYGYVREGNIYRVAGLNKLAREREAKKKLEQYEELVTEVIHLQYLDAQDAKKVLKGSLSKRGKIKVLERKTVPGWEVGGGSVSSPSGSSGSISGASGSYSGAQGAMAPSGLITQRRNDQPAYERSRTILIIDMPSVIKNIKNVLARIDRIPRQVMIDAMVLELTMSDDDHLGIRWDSLKGLRIRARPSQTLTDNFTHTKTLSDVFSLEEGASNETGRVRNVNNLSGNASSDVTTETTGNTSDLLNTHELTNSKTDVFSNLRTAVLNSDELSIVLSALASKGDIDIISSPNILTLDNHEATILVGENFPIFTTSVSDQGTVTESFQYYQPVGISLRVIPQVSANSHINMLIHPTVSEIGEFVTGTTGLQYPRINIREADTQVLIEEGQTVVIGGLVSGRDEETISRVPLLGDIPFVGLAFRHKSIEKKKINLMVFVTPKLVKPDQISEEEEQVFQSFLKMKKVDVKNGKKPKKFFSPPAP